MHTYKRNWKGAAIIAAFGAASWTAQAQSADALINKLIEKGVLTVKEANELKEEADKDFTAAHSVKTGMPDWVTSFKFNGDLRGRYDGVYMPELTSGLNLTPAATSGNFVDRHRFRYRLRFGAVAVMKENFEAGFRLTSSEPQVSGTAQQGGDPISGNTSFNDNGSKKFVYIDLAYGRWTALNTPDFKLVTTVGKMENPFVVSEMMFDGDYTPEGAAINFNYNINDDHILKLNLGAFALDEISAKTADPYLAGVQVRHDANWTKKLQSSVGAGMFWISHEENLADADVPNLNRGNTRSGGFLAQEFATWVADAAVTYSLDHAPFYKAAFPIKVGGEFIHNTAANDRNEGYGLGITFGKAGKKGLWEVSYKWKELQGDMWYEEMVDSDFGAVYQATSPASSALGYRAGTNLRGHVFRTQYSPADSFTLAATIYLAEVVCHPGGATGGVAVPGNYDSQTLRVQVDASWKF